MRRSVACIPSVSTCDETESFFSEHIEKIFLGQWWTRKGVLAIESETQLKT